MHDIFISFIIPCYRSGATINEALESIIKAVLNLISFEIILVSESEKDDTFSYIDNKYDNFILKYYSYYPGVTANRNVGLLNSKGKYVYFLDSDDVLASGEWVSILKKVQDNGIIDVFFGKTKNFNEHSKYFINHKNCVLLSKKDFDAFYGDDDLVSFSYCSYIFKRTFLVQNDIFVDKTIKNAEDYLFVGLFLSKCPKMYVIDNVLNEYVKRRSSLSNKYDIITAKSYVSSFVKLFELLGKNNFLLSLDRFRLTFVCVHLDIGYKLDKKDRLIFNKVLKENNIRKEVVKKCPNCNKKKIYLLLGFRLGWWLLRVIHSIKGIE